MNFQVSEARQQYNNIRVVNAAKHTHPECDCHRDRELSPQDKWLADFLDITVFAITPNGNILSHPPR